MPPTPEAVALLSEPLARRLGDMIGLVGRLTLVQAEWAEGRTGHALMLQGVAPAHEEAVAKAFAELLAFLPQVPGGILFVEDVNEHPYRIERMLTQLLHAGVLAQQKAVLLGQFTNYKLAPHDKGYKLQSVVDWLRTQIKAPVLTNLPFGHVETKVLLPVGATVSLSVEERDALIYWGHQH